MASAIRINGVTINHATVPFGVPVALLNADLTGVTTQTWELIYPDDIAGTNPDFAVNFVGWTLGGDGILRITQTGSYPAVNFTPDISGDYGIRLTATAGSQLVLTAVVRIPDQFSGEFVPFPGMTTEANTLRGWAEDRNHSIKVVGRHQSKGSFIRVVNTSGSSIARGRVAKINGFVDTHSITPNVVPTGASVKPEKIPTITLAHANDAGIIDSKLVILDETITNNGIGWVQISGPFEGGADVDYSGFTANAPVYLSNTGTQVATPGTTTVFLGSVIEPSPDGSAFIDMGGGVTFAKVQAALGAATTNVSLNNHTFTNLSAPVNPTDAARLADILVFSESTIAALGLLDATTFPNQGVRAFVNSVRDWWRLDKTTTRTPDGITIIAALGGGFWVREGIGDPLWGSFAFVSIDPVNGSDEAFGFGTSMVVSDAVALKTFAELNRRIPEGGFNNDTLCHVLDSIPDAEEDFMVLTRLRVQSYDTQFVIFGALTSTARPSLYSGTVASYVTAVPSTNTKRQLTLASSPGAGLVGHLIQKADGSKSAYILSSLGSNAYRISKPTTVNPQTGVVGNATEFVNGESVVVYDLLTMPIHPFPASVFTRDVTSSTSNLILGNTRLRSSDTSHGVEIDSGGSSSKLLNCILHEPIIFGGVNCTWSNVLFTTGLIGLGFMAGIDQLELNACAFLNTQMLIYNSSIEFLTSFDIEGSSFQTAFATLHMQRGNCAVTMTVTELGIFNSAVSLVATFVPNGFYVATNGSKVYGSGNSGIFYGPAPGCRWAFNAADHTAASSAAHPISIQGVNYDLVDLPISLLFSQTVINSS